MLPLQAILTTDMATSPTPDPATAGPSSSASTSPPGRLALPQLDSLIQFYFEQGLSSSTHRTYTTGINRFNKFCTDHHINSPFPLSQSLLCYYVSYLADQGLSTGTIKVYLSALRHKQVALGFPDPQHSTMPKLKVIINRITRAKAKQPVTSRGKPRLPITPAILHQIKRVWSRDSTDPDTMMLWAVCTTAFFGFFHMGELTIPTSSAFDPSSHLSLKDIAIDRRDDPSVVQIHLKVSKTDQERKGVSIFVGKTGDDLCQVSRTNVILGSTWFGRRSPFSVQGSNSANKG